jgi:ubiquinone/menaquinone biosynthesis C-methylase UbiE
MPGRNEMGPFVVYTGMTMNRSRFLLALAGAARSIAQERPKMHLFERQDFAVADFEAAGYVLDIGGGGEGIIGLMKPAQTVAIDLSKRELEESPPGPLKIVMDATDLKFLDASFNTVTAFFSLMYMRPAIQQKVCSEVFRALKPGGRWLIWDAVIPTAMESDTKGPVFRFRLQLPGKVIQTGYGTLWPDKPMDLDYYKALAKQAGFELAKAERRDGTFQTFTLELRKPL